MITNKKFICQFSTEPDCGFFPKNLSLADLLFFDIETTGLSAKTSRVFLIGAIQYSETHDAFEMIQFLAENQTDQEELLVLQAFEALAAPKSCLVHFNGTSFDLPFLERRYEACGLLHTLRNHRQADLYKELLSMPGFFRQMPDRRQKTFEILAGFQRTDTLSGKDMVTVYKTYADSPDISTRHLLLLHNEEDLKGMLALISLGGLKKLLQKNYEIKDVKEITEPTVEGTLDRKLLFTLTLDTLIPGHLSVNAGFCYITVQNNQAKIKMPLFEGTLRYFYPDYKNYYYLPYEEEAVHKSVAAYLDPSRRQKATAANCCKKVSGTFLYAPGTPNLPLFKEEYRSKEHYIQWPLSIPTKEVLISFLHEVLKTAVTR